MKLDDYERAINDFSRVIELDFIYAEGYTHRKSGRDKRIKYDYSIIDWASMFLLEPSLTNVYFIRGIAFRGKGFYDCTKGDFCKSCELGDNNGCLEYEKILNIKKRIVIFKFSLSII